MCCFIREICVGCEDQYINPGIQRTFVKSTQYGIKSPTETTSALSSFVWRWVKFEPMVSLNNSLSLLRIWQWFFCSKKYLLFYWIKFIALFTNSHNFTSFSSSWIHSKPSHFLTYVRSILKLSSYCSLGLPSTLFPSSFLTFLYFLWHTVLVHV
jgi:hypothetical protein